MSAGEPTGAGGAGKAQRRGRLPEWLRPRSEERRGRGELRIVETFVLVVAGLVLLGATFHDLVREVHIGSRLSADLASWKKITGSYYHNPLIEQDIKTYTTRDIVCANTEKGKPEGKVQICLIFTAPVHDGWRPARGGYYLIAKGTDVHEPVLNKSQYAYGCFGSATAEHICLATPPPGEPDRPLLGGA
jgi:hypothetical protein